MSKQIAIDAMGGDYAPKEIVLGALEAVRRYAVPVVLVGDETQIRPLVEAQGMASDPLVTIHHASQTIAMDEHPAMAFRKKKGCIRIGVRPFGQRRYVRCDDCARIDRRGRHGRLVRIGTNSRNSSAGDRVGAAE